LSHPSPGGEKAARGRWGGERKKGLQPKLEPDDRQARSKMIGRSRSKVGQKGKGGGVCHSAKSLGSGRRRDPQLSVAIQSSEGGGSEERLSDTPYMYSTSSVGNRRRHMSAMQIRMAQDKKMAPPEGRAEPPGSRAKGPLGGNAARCKGGGRKQARCDVLHIWAGCLFANQSTDMSDMRLSHGGRNRQAKSRIRWRRTAKFPAHISCARPISTLPKS
jgi:hypothetical protein